MAEDHFLSEKEITAFINDLDKNNNGHIEYDEVEFKLDQVHKEIAPQAKPHNLHYKDESDAQKQRRHAFLRSVIGTDKNQIGRDDFANIVRGWKVPSMEPDKKAEDEHKEFMKEMGIGRKVRAWWSVRGPEVLFVGMVVGMQIAFGTWQCVKYVTQMQYRHVSSLAGLQCLAVFDKFQAFGWGVVMAKTAAGVLCKLHRSATRFRQLTK